MLTIKSSRICLALLLLSLVGCHPAELIVPSYIHTIGVDPVKNQTSYFGLDSTLTENLDRQIQVDGRLTLEDPEKADLLVKTVIRQFTINPIFYDPKTNMVLQYQLSVTYDIAAVDQVEKKTLLEDNSQMHSVYYYTAQNVGAITETQDQATARLLDETAQLAVRRILEGY